MNNNFIMQIIDFIEDNLYNDFSLDNLEKNFGISKSFLLKAFHAITTITIFEYVRNRRLYLAALDLINTKDRIVFGTNTILLYMKTSKGDDIYGVDWESAQMELQKEIEKETKKEIEEKEKKKKEEIDSLKKDIEEEYATRENEKEEKLRKQVEEYQ